MIVSIESILHYAYYVNNNVLYTTKPFQVFEIILIYLYHEPSNGT